MKSDGGDVGGGLGGGAAVGIGFGVGLTVGVGLGVGGAVGGGPGVAVAVEVGVGVFVGTGGARTTAWGAALVGVCAKDCVVFGDGGIVLPQATRVQVHKKSTTMIGAHPRPIFAKRV